MGLIALDRLRFISIELESRATVNGCRELSVLELECSIEECEPLRMPGVYRVHTICKDLSIAIELVEDVYKLPSSGKTLVYIGKDKDKCMEKEFCGQAHVVSITSLSEDTKRAVLSIGGLLVVIKGPKEHEVFNKLEVVEKYYIGIKRIL